MTGMERLAVLVAAALALGGCGSAVVTSAAPPGTPSPTPLAATATPVPTQVPTPTPGPSAVLAGLASQYTVLATKGDTVLAQCEKDRQQAGSSLTKRKAAAQDCLDTYDKVVAQVQGTTWGPVQAQADAVTAAMANVRAIVQQMADASSDSRFMAAYGRLSSAEQDLLTCVNTMRAALGLPPAAP